MQTWNVIATIRGADYTRARRLLAELGEVRRTEFYNVLTIRVDDVSALLEELRARLAADPHALDVVARLMPVTERFVFQTAEEFRHKAAELLQAWAPRLSGKSFHIRMHRRGFKGRLSSHEEERALAGALLQALEQTQAPVRVVFADPDAIVAVETIGNEAGLSLWERGALQRYPFLQLD
jgi:tRNA(Ser,Leu) C12 N-acetylase TAN1